MDEYTSYIWEMKPNLEAKMFEAWRRARCSCGAIKLDAEQDYMEIHEQYFKYFGMPFSCQAYARGHGLSFPEFRERN